jgi:cold shock protein
MPTGKVKFFTGERGFGFIRPDAGGADIFFHVSAIAEGDDPAVGQAVTFEIGVDAKSGKPKAIDVEIV